MNVQCSDGLRSFAKEMRALKIEHRGRPLQVDNNQVRAIIEADPLTSTQGVAKELAVNHSTAI